MPRVSILRRDRAVRFPEPQRLEEVAAVTYTSNAVPPRVVHVPIGSYRDATPEELAQSPRYKIVPVDDGAQQLELRAIEQDMHAQLSGPPATFDL